MNIYTVQETGRPVLLPGFHAYNSIFGEAIFSDHILVVGVYRALIAISLYWNTKKRRKKASNQGW